MTNFSINAEDAAIRRVGAQLTRGVVGQIGLYLLIFILLLVAYELSGLHRRDATDSPDERSGVRLRTDYGTGCQYLETADGGITPRLGRDGRQVCR